MADVVKIGNNVNDGTGDDLRTAFQKVNTKFAELDARGGESNTGVNLGTEQADGQAFFAGKSGFNLQFKRIRSADPARLTITSDGESIILDNSAVATPAVRTIQFSNDVNNVNNSITTSTGNESVGFVGGSNITLSQSGRNLVITGAFTVDQDPSPELGGDLAMQGNNIIGPGEITSLTNIESADATFTNATVSNQFTVNGLTTLTGVVTAAGGVTGNLTGNVTGNVTGNLIGGLGGNLATNGYTIEGGHRFKLRRGDPANNVLADEIADGDFYVQLDETSPTAAFRRLGTENDQIESFLTVSNHTTQANVNNGMGVGIDYLIGTSSGVGESLGQLGAYRKSGSVNAFIIQPIDPLNPIGETFAPVAEFKSNNEIILGAGEGQIKISAGTIETVGTSNNNLQLNADGAGYVDLYGAYQFPRSIGQAGQVLKVPTSGTVLEWGIGGGGGGGTPKAITAITQANPGVITTAEAHGLSDGQPVTITDVVGMTELNGNEYYADVLSSTTFALYSDDTLSTTVDTSGFTAYANDGSGFATGEASGSGSVDFVGLTDTPSSYAAAAGDADKIVQVNATGDGIEFTSINNIVNATYIEGKGFMPKSGGTFSGNITVQDIIATANTDIGSSGTPARDIYANNFRGQHVGAVVGNVTGNLTGNVTGDVTGNVTGNVTSTGTSTFNNITLTGALSVSGGSITADISGNVTGNVTGNLTGNTTGIHNGNVNATSGTSVFNIVNIASASATGNITANSFTGDITSPGNSTFDSLTVSGTISNSSGDIELNDNTNITGTLTVSGLTTINNKLDVNGQIDLGDLRIDANNIETQTSNSNLRIAANGTGFLELEGDVRLNGVVSLSGTNELIIGSTQSPSTINMASTVTFVTANDWTSASAGLAFATLPDGGQEGQMKILKMKNRGRYSLDGVSFFDRYVEVSLKINGAASTIDLSNGTNNEHGALTLIWHSGSWWLVSEYIET